MGTSKRANARAYLALNLKLARAVCGWSQDDLARCCGLKRTYVGAIERRQINPGIDNLDRIASGLGVAGYVLLMSPDEAQPLLYKKLKARGRPR